VGIRSTIESFWERSSAPSRYAPLAAAMQLAWLWILSAGGVLSVSPAKVEATESCWRGIVGGLYLVVRRARLRVAEDSGVLPEVSGGGERQ
jgi:hypothetical protein